MGKLVEFAERELRLAGLFDKDSDYRGLLGVDVLALVRLFEEQGHSGFSAARTLALFNKMADYLPLTPLTGNDDEWMEVMAMAGLYQNKRCSRIFKRDGRAYDLEGRAFREPSGATYTCFASRTPVTFPYAPTTEIVNVAALEEA